MSGKRAANERETLRECPFCGGKAFVARGMRDRIGLWHSAVLCENPECGASVPCTPATDPSDSMQEAANRWNRRHERTCHDVSREAGRFECSGCGATVDVEDESGEPTMWKRGYPQVLRFCPCCGARVSE